MDHITDPPVPYIEPIRGEFGPGRMVRIQGSTLPMGKAFNVNLQCGPRTNPRDDLSLHLSVRYLEGVIARNSLDNGTWDVEQRDGTSPIGAGQKFEIIILSDAKVYKIAVNGNHFCEFSQKIPSFRVTHLSVDGDVTVSLISYEGGSSVVTAPPVSGNLDFQKEILTQAPVGGYGPPGGYAPPGGGYGPPGGGYGPPGGGYGPSGGFGAPAAPYADAPPPYGGPAGGPAPYGAPQGPYGPSPYGGTTQPYGAPGPYGGAPGPYGGTPMPYGPPGQQQQQKDGCGPSWDCCGCKISLADILCWTSLYCCCRMLCESVCSEAGG